MKKIALIFLGCPKNQVDCEKILYSLLKNNYRLTNDLAESEIAILTTCAFIKKGIKECENWLKKLIKLKEKGKLEKIILFGCLIEREGERLLAKYPEVDHFVGLAGLAKIPQIIKSHQRFYWQEEKEVLIKTLPRIISPPFAYLKIADGCQNFCAYCLIPKIRGNYQSRKSEEIVKEAKELVNLGIKELILVAQDTTLYGIDLYQKPSLSLLLKELVKIDNLRWLRILYTHPAHYDDELLTIIKEEEKIVKYLDIPIQHASNKILKLMNRPYTQKDLIKLLKKLRKIPQLVLRTTVMVGFPFEEERDFLELLAFIKDWQFEYLGCFLYSREENTVASRLAGQIKEEIKKERYHRLMACQQKITFNFLDSLKDKETVILVEKPNSGRAYFQAPEIDGKILFKKAEVNIGDFLLCQINQRKGYNLLAKIINKKIVD